MGHLFTRAIKTLRWHPLNIFAQCSGCNLHHEQNAKPFEDWFKYTYGKKTLEDLIRLGSETFDTKHLPTLKQFWEGVLEGNPVTNYPL